jgi:mRNA interferase MazF
VVARAYVPDTGDLVWLTFDPQAGHEQRGRRPALILSPRSYNSKARLAIACPITSHVKGYPFEVPLPQGGKISGVILADRHLTTSRE